MTLADSVSPALLHTVLAEIGHSDEHLAESARCSLTLELGQCWFVVDN